MRDPSILLLDEATPALDPATEAAINQTFERLARGRTMISVTHRLSTAVHMDRIFVMDRGKLAEIPLLARTSEAARAELAAWFTTERFRDGQEIICEGDAGNRLYIIARGTVDVVREDSKQHLARLSDGDYFDCVCLSLQHAHFQQLLMREPHLRREVEQVAAVRAGAQA